MKTKEKVIYWLTKHEHLRDDDNRLCCNIWNAELKEFRENPSAQDFLRLYALGALTPAPSIKRARAKLQEENPKFRGQKYNLRKSKLRKNWKKVVGL